jgi:hypothetical protein
MSEPATLVRELERGDEVRIPDVGPAQVLLPAPREATTLEPGVAHAVFAHPSGRTIGLNWAPPAGDADWEELRLLADEDGYQHALLLRPGAEVRLLTRRPPGQPDDWEDRGEVTGIERADDS